tara:strand:+ start:246 stop:452 length:207 start_codon:yes stop_codon:yes gene_type:complete
LRPTTGHQHQSAEGKTEQQSDAGSKKSKQVEACEESNHGHDFEDVVVDQLSAVGHGLKGAVVVMNQQR